MVNNNRNVLKEKSNANISTKQEGKNDEVKLSKQEAIELCKLARGIKRLLESKIAKA
jgi:hypothetical protein